MWLSENAPKNYIANKINAKKMDCGRVQYRSASLSESILPFQDLY